MTIRYIDLVDYLAIAAEVTSLDAATVMKVANLDLADSALHASAAGFGDTDLYPDFVDKAAVLIVPRVTTHSPTATSEPRGSRCASSSRRTAGPGTHDHRSRTPKRPCSRSLG